MNKSTLKTLLYFILGFMIFSAILSFFFRILPFLLLGGGAIYLAVKVYGFFKKDSVRKGSNSYESSSYSSEEVYQDDYVDTSEAIDVDYEEVDK